MLKRFARWLLRRELEALEDDVGRLVAAVLTDRRWRGFDWAYDPSREECRVTSLDDPGRPGEFHGLDHLYAIGLVRDLLKEREGESPMAGEVIHALSDLTCTICGEPVRRSDRVHAEDGEPLAHEACHVQEKARRARPRPAWNPADQERWHAGD